MSETTQVTEPAAESSQDVLLRDTQRESLAQIVQLANECAAEELRVDETHDSAIERENSAYDAKVRDARDLRERRLDELSENYTQRHSAITGKFDEQQQAVETAYSEAEQRITLQKKEVDTSVTKQSDEACWWAENVYSSIQGNAIAEEQKLDEGRVAAEEEMVAINSLEQSARDVMAREGIEIEKVEATLDSELKQQIADDGKAVMIKHRETAAKLLDEFREIVRPRPMVTMILLILVLALIVGAGIGGWRFAPTDEARLQYAGFAALGAMLVGIILLVMVRHKRRNRIEAKADMVGLSLVTCRAVARYAARPESAKASEEREANVKKALATRDRDVRLAREKAQGILDQANEKYRNAISAESKKFNDSVAVIERERQAALDKLKMKRETLLAEIESANEKTLEEAQSHHERVTAEIEAEYRSNCQALEARWADGMRIVSELASTGDGVDPQFAEWDSPEWKNWKSPKSFVGHVRFGEMSVDLSQLIERIPRRLKLPETFSIPAMLALPGHSSLLVETDHAGREKAIEAVQMVMTRLLTQLPAGGVKFTLFDPVGLGQSFAGFMHLADHDESLIGSRVWTEREHFQQRLTDLTEHMETVIQKYLRNEYATIDQYNAQAGELAEPIRFVVIADFPTGFDADALRRLTSIATSGPRCGVYTIIIRDSRQPIPAGARMEEITAHSVCLEYKDGDVRWNDPVFKQFPLHMDAPATEQALTNLMDIVGKAAKEAKRVEVPFSSIAPKDGQFWTLTSKSDLKVPIGKMGATRLQSLRLGVGVAQHALVAGKTGSGKSNLMHTVVTNLAMWYSPDEVEFYLVDFKKGVEFKTYASCQLPHARAIAVESDREVGLSVLQRVDGELTRRGAMFREGGAQEISSFREKTGQKLPRTLLLIDEFQEFFSEDDKLGQDAAGLLDRLVRQGRAFGVHVVLGSQSIGGTSGLSRSTLGQIAVRVALQCTDADSQMILGDNNSAARLLTRPGEAVYNDAGGLVEANSPFQIAFLPDDQRERYLMNVRAISQSKHLAPPTPIVFEGNIAADIRGNSKLMALLKSKNFSAPASAVPAYVGEPVAIKDPSALPIRRQSGGNVIMVGQQEESAIAMFASSIASLAAQHAPESAIFYLLDGTPADSKYFGLLERVLQTIPHKINVVGIKQVPEAINEIATQLKERQANDSASNPSIYLMMFGLQRYRMLRKQEDDFSFSRGEENAAPKPEKQFPEILSEGPPLGIHTFIWTDSHVTIERTLDRGAMRQFDHRVLFQMSAADSSNLIDSPLANRLGAHRALLYSEEQGTLEKCRPYGVPDESWLTFLRESLKEKR